MAAATLLPKQLLTTEEKEAIGPLVGVARGEPSKLVRAATEAIGGIGDFISEGDRVCIKPNLSFAADAATGATTSPDVVKQTVELCLEAGASRVVITDHTIHDPELCVEKCGVEQAILDKERVSLVVLGQERQFVHRDVPEGKELKSIEIAKILEKSDKLINLPTAKSHSATGVSLGMKNLMGLIWDRPYLHRRDLHTAIAELGTVMKPDLTIIDATRALTTGGPRGPGKTVVLNTVVASPDTVAADSYCVGLTDWYGRAYTGDKVKYILAASRLGLGEIDTGKMRMREVET
jgi:uncharacterized protein (DUF362 family)